MWRYSQLLPVRSPSSVVSLGEGWTPVLASRELVKQFGMERILIKDESRNPTFSFKDRGLCVAISKHIELGARSFALPSAGNAAVSMSAYCAAAGVQAHVFMPTDTPALFFRECQMYGTDTVGVPGTIADSGSSMRSSPHNWVDLSTTREPYRVEGKKTMGFEISEQLGWNVPDAIVCPTGGGTAIIGIWKAFSELEEIGLVGSERPRLYVVQTEGCAPVVRAIERGQDDVEMWQDCRTKALGLRVPKPFAGRLILRAIRESGGSALSVPESAIDPMRVTIAQVEGLNVCPETAVAFLGLKGLIETGKIETDDNAVVLNTGAGYRYYTAASIGSQGLSTKADR
jgi:threonine synthase